MADTGLSRSPKLLKGALVQLVDDVILPIPNVIVFQYNPAKLSRSLTPWNPFAADQSERGGQAPSVQPFEPQESFTLTLEIDATDELANGDPIATATGIADRLAALKKLTQPTSGLFSDLLQSAQEFAGTASAEAERPTVPIVLLVWGPGRILPVRITSFSVEETLFSPQLYPTQATVSLSLEVLTPDVFGCTSDTTVDLAVAAYKFTKLQEDALAVANLANSVESVLGMLPF